MAPVLSRRQLVRSIACYGAALSLPEKALALPASGEQIAFRAYRDGAEIGSHRLTFSSEGDGLRVDIEIRFDVTFAFLNLYSYRHRSREAWRGGRLVSLATSTDDDGDRFAVQAQAEAGRLVVETGAGEVVALPHDTLPTSYWHETTVRRTQWLDTQSGRLVRSRVARLGEERIDAAGDRVTATRYRLQGDLNCELWYAERRWSKLRFAAGDGSTVEYELEASSLDKAAWFVDWPGGGGAS